MKRSVLLVLLVCLVAVAMVAARPTRFDPIRGQFYKWKSVHGKAYETPEEEDLRFNIFKKNLMYIRNHNRQTEKTFTLAMNQFGDLTNEEFRATMNGYRRSANRTLEKTTVVDEQILAGLPASVDWRQQGAVTAVKNQGQCGSCWSFSSTGSIEGQWAIAGNNLVGLSEQNLIDCSTNYGTQGCNGGEMTDAFQYVIANNGIDSEASYPYQAQGPLNCRYTVANKAATISSFKSLPSGSESALQSASASIGPISVAIDASHNSFQFYSGGVYYEPQCSSTQLDHGVLVVGYGTQSGQDYWIVKNSWGTTWGLQGYILMSRNRDNNCGIATDASYPLTSGSTGGGSSASSKSTGSSSSSSGSSSGNGSTSGGSTTGGRH
eukprot:TRINITY_DN927_c0_g1_i2.p1 TRINITY_DN927_c0_g1~~TRINITY_DN927_c0_g1_i2.p1  ORF type:complete len:378 (-),score=95.51 TRINITY_DN927_c0_g1_i2:158-1291(-)